MRIKLLVLAGGFFLVSLLGILSCDKCGPFPDRFKVIDLDWSVHRAFYGDTTYYKGLTLSGIGGDSVQYAEFAIFINPKWKTYYSENTARWNFDFITSAYACDPAPPQTDEKIDSIVITTTKDFDINHPAGSDLSDLFDVEVTDNVNYIDHERYRLTEYTSTNQETPTYLTLILTNKPDLVTDFAFRVQYYQEGIDFDYFEFTTGGIVIK